MKQIKHILLLLLLSLSTTLFAQEVNLTTNPNPAIQGGRLRFTLKESLGAKTVIIVFSNNYSIRLTKIDKGLFSGSFEVPKDYPIGPHDVRVKIFTSPTESLILPITFNVSATRSPQEKQVDGQSLQISANDEIDRDLKIDELENERDKLENENETLKDHIKDLQAEIDKLRKEKADQALIEQKQKELAKLQEELNQLQNDLNKQNEDLKARLALLLQQEKSLSIKEEDLKKLQTTLDQQSQSLEKRDQAIESKNKELEKKDKELTQLSVQLTTKDKELDQKKAELDKLKEAMSSMSTRLTTLDKTLKKEQSSLAKREQEIKEQEAQLNNRESELNSLSTSISSKDKELSTLSVTLKEESKELAKIQTEISKKEKSLLEKESDLQGVISTIEERSKNLEILKSNLKTQQKTLNSQSGALSKKETQLTELEKQILSEQNNLKALSATYEEKNTELQTQRKQLIKERREVQNKQADILKTQTTVQNQKVQIIKISKELEEKLSAFKKEQARSRELNEREQAVLAKKKEEINQITGQLKSAKDNLTVMEKSLTERHESLKVSTDAIQKQLVLIEQQEAKMKTSLADMQTLEKNLLKQYSSIEELKEWLINHVESLETMYIQSAHSKKKSEEETEKKVDQLETLVGLLKNQTLYLERQNNLLFKRVNDLEWGLKGRADAKNRYAFTPYLGYRFFNSSTDLKNGTEFGIMFSEYLRNNLTLDTRVGYVSSELEENADNDTTSSVQRYVTIYGADIAYDYAPIASNVTLVVLAGLHGDFEFQDISVNLGTRIKYRIYDDLLALFTLEKDRDFTTSLGIQRRFTIGKKDGNSAFNVTELENDLNKNQVETYLNVPDTKYETIPVDVTYLDMNTHWAKSTVEDISNLGIIVGTNQPITNTNDTPTIQSFTKSSDNQAYFNPNIPVRKFDATRMIIMSIFRKVKQPSNDLPITFSIFDYPGIPNYVDLAIVDSQQNVIRDIYSNEKHYGGTYTVNWDGKDNNGHTLPEGQYNVQLTLYNRNKFDEKVVISGSKIKSFNLIHQPQQPFVSQAKAKTFKDVPADFWGRPIIFESEAIGLFKALKEEDSSNFDPTKVMTRIEFIVTIGRALEILGAKSYTIADLSPYKDVNQIKEKDQPYLRLYISELGYGGDDQGRLNPHKPITRAEAATIMSRFVSWLEGLEEPSL